MYSNYYITKNEQVVQEGAMNPEIKAEWTTRLRSDQYKQGASYLAANEKYCCLGVLCEIAVEHGIVCAVKEHNAYEGDIVFFNEEAKYLPKAVKEWAGITSNAGCFELTDEDHFRTLSILNDNGSTFEEIATLIEEQF